MDVSDFLIQFCLTGLDSIQLYLAQLTSENFIQFSDVLNILVTERNILTLFDKMMSLAHHYFLMPYHTMMSYAGHATKIIFEYDN